MRTNEPIVPTTPAKTTRSRSNKIDPTNPWYWGQKTELARAVGKPLPYISDILNGRRAVKPELARRIAQVTKQMKGATVTMEDLLFPLESKNPAILYLREQRGQRFERAEGGRDAE